MSPNPSPNSAAPGGILLIDKPAGLTSADVVRRVKRRLGGPRVGHLGTLDPFATGLLPLAIGEGLKVVQFLNQESKAYAGTVTLGAATDTLDSTGRVTETAAVPDDVAARLEAVAARFRGDIEQVPPMYSAIKRDGTRMYELARKGVALELEPRRVRIDTLDLRAIGPAEIALDVHCSKGTYVRSLARDLAAALGTVGHLSALRRTRFGTFDLSAATPLEDLVERPVPISPRAALVDLREIESDADLVRRIRLGQQYALAKLPAPRGSDEVAKIIGPSGELVAIVAASGASWKILRVLDVGG